MDTQRARESLRMIATVRRQTVELRNYRAAGSIVVVWGLVWLAGFGAQQFLPALAVWVWLVGWILALTWTATRPRHDGDWRSLATWLVALGSVGLLLMVVGADLRTAAMVFALVLAASYLVLGIWAGHRFALLGMLALITSCIGWWVAPAALFIALALGGGGALILGGLWLQRP